MIPSSLPSPLVTATVAALALGAGGCFFLDEINHPPTAEVRVVRTQRDTAIKGTEIEFDPTGSSDVDAADRDQLAYEWTIDGLTVDEAVVGRRVRRCTQSVDPNQCFAFLQAGTHKVGVVAVDRYHARSVPAEVSVPVLDAPPTVSIVEGTRRNLCGDWIVGQPVLLAAEVSDDDGEILQGEGKVIREVMHYQWRVRSANGQDLAAIGAPDAEGRCDPTRLTTLAVEWPPEPRGSSLAQQVCVLVSQPGSWTVEVRVDDDAPRFSDPKDPSTDRRPMAQAPLAISADHPACGYGFDPPAAPLVLPRSEPARFRVTQVYDDLDGFPAATPTKLRLAWSTWRARDPVWRAAREWSMPEYVVDPSGFGVDELVRVRVRVLDRAAAEREPTKCSVEDSLCPLDKTYAPKDLCAPEHTDRCQEWVTWDVRFR